MIARIEFDFLYQEKSFSIRAGIEKGRPIPSWVLEEPLITEEDNFYLKAFKILSTSRINSMSAGVIPWSAILDYGIRFGLDSENLDPFLDIIMQMDDSYLEMIAKRDKK